MSGGRGPALLAVEDRPVPREGVECGLGHGRTVAVGWGRGYHDHEPLFEAGEVEGWALESRAGENCVRKTCWNQFRGAEKLKIFEIQNNMERASDRSIH